MSMTAKEYYELVVQKLKDRLLPALNPDAQICKYKMSDGKKCMIGLLIPDEKYSKDLEGNGIAIDYPETSPLYNIIEIPQGMTLNDLNMLQMVHDNFTISNDPSTGVSCFHL